MNIPIYSPDRWIEAVLALPRPGARSVTAFYEHRVGAVCRDPKLLLFPADDHIFHRGDGVFESLRLSEGKILQFGAHLRRLKRSAEAIGIALPVSEEDLRDIAVEVSRAGGEREGSLKIFIGRGEGGFGVSPVECQAPSLYCIACRSARLPESYWQKGLTACRSAIPAKQEWLAGIKSTNYLPNALMAAEAAARGTDVSLCFDEKGNLAEASVANIGIVDEEGRLLMPRFERALPGTTAMLAMKLASASMPAEQTDLAESDLRSAREVLMFGTTPECVSIVSYEGAAVNDGKPGPVSGRLRREIHASMLEGGTPFMD